MSSDGVLPLELDIDHLHEITVENAHDALSRNPSGM